MVIIQYRDRAMGKTLNNYQVLNINSFISSSHFIRESAVWDQNVVEPCFLALNLFFEETTAPARL